MTGFPRMPIRNQEPLIRNRLRLGFPEKTFTIERVPQTLSLTEFKRIARTTPFIGIAWVGMRPDPTNGRVLKGAMLWRFILINSVSNGLEARFKGDAKEIGMDAMVDVSMVLLQGVDFRDHGFTTITAANSVVADGWPDDNIAISQVDFSFSFAVTPAATGLLTPDEFMALGITWSVSDNEASDTVTDELQPQE